MQHKYLSQGFIFFLLLTSRCFAQNIAPNQLALKKALSKQDAGYSIRTGDNRYEGFFNKEKGEEDFRVFSLLRGKLSYLMTDKEKLRIITRKLPGVDSVYVAGTSFNFSPDYRLDLRLKAGQEARVPLKDAIKVKSLFQDNLGIYGYTSNTTGAPEYYVPIEVQSTANPANQAEYVLTLISIKSVAEVSWDYLPAGKGAAPVQGNSTVDYVPARSPITLPLKFNETLQAGTIVTIQVWGRIAGHKTRERLQKLKIMLPKA